MPITSLEFKHLVFGYPESGLVFDNFSFAFGGEEPVILQGPVGGGKNTLMKLILGLVAPTSGDYLINQQKVNGWSHREFDQYRKRMGFAFETGGLINNRTLWENLTLPIDYHQIVPSSQRQDYLMEFIRPFALEEYLHLRPAFVSSGVRKIFSVLRSFLTQPDVLILNNPSLGLNHEHLEPLLKLLLAARQKNLKFLLVVTEDAHFIHSIGGKIYQVTKTELKLIKQVNNLEAA